MRFVRANSVLRGRKRYRYSGFISNIGIHEDVDAERLMGLIRHWVEHNEEHRLRLREAAEEAKALGLPEVSEALRRAAKGLGEASKWLVRALEGFGNQ